LRPFQLIIVDNDIPPDIARRMKVVSFGRGNGFIRDLEILEAAPIALTIYAGPLPGLLYGR
jgi:hypothetical protein